MGPEGGTLVFGPWTLAFPPGAVERPTRITGEAATGFPASASILAPPYTFGPDGLDLTGKGVQISTSYDPAALGAAGEDELSIGLAGVGWTVLAGSSVDAANVTVGAGIEHFSTFALLAGTEPGLEVPPIIQGLTVSTTALPEGVPTPVTLTWTYALPPSAAVNCELDGVAITSGVPLNLTRSGDGVFELVCQNTAGDDRQTITFAASVAPVLTSFVASPPVVPALTPTVVTFSWSFETAPVPPAACTISGVGAVENGATVELTLLLPTVYTLTCQNNASTDATTVTVTTTAPLSIPIALVPGAIHLDLGGGIVLDAPANALIAPTNSTLAFDPNAPPNPNQIGMAITFTPPVWFQQPATLTLPYSEAALAMFGLDLAEILKTVGIASLNPEGAWEPLHTVIDTVAKTVTVEVNHLTSFTVIANGLVNNLGAPTLGPLAAATWGAKATHPLRWETSRLANIAELAVGMPRAIGADKSGGFLVYDHDKKEFPTDADKTFLTQSSANFANIEEKAWGAVAGDFDYDGLDEFAVLGTKWFTNRGEYSVWYLVLTVFDDSKHNFAQLARWTSRDNPLGAVTNDGTFSYYDADLDVARIKDYNGVSREFIMVIGSYGRMNSSEHKPVYLEGAHGWMFDLKNGTWKNPWRKQLADGAGRVYETRAAVAREDNLVYFAGQFPGQDTFLIQHKFQWTDANTLNNVYQTKKPCGNANRPSVVTGDFNKDYKDEVALHFYDNESGTFVIETWKVVNGQWNKLQRKDSFRGNGLWGHGTARMYAADLDNDRYDEIVFNVFLKSGGSPSNRSNLWWYDVNDNKFDQVQDDWLHYGGVAIGNFDADEYNELAVVFRHPDNNQYVFRQFQYDEGKYWSKSYGKVFNRASSGSYTEPWIAAGDYDADSTVVKYLNQWRYDRNDSLPVVAISYSPYWDRTPAVQNSGVNSVGVDFSQTETTEEAKSLGLSSEASVSVEAGDPLGIVTAEATFSFETEFTVTNTQSKSTTKAVSFVCDLDEDCVVSQYVYWDHYKYQVLASKDPARIGEEIVVSVPRSSPRLGIDALSYYNANNGGAPDLGAETFDHAIGCPTSYPSTTTSGAWTSDEYTVPVGASIGLVLSESLGSSRVTENSWGMKMEAGLSVGGVGFSSSVGVNRSSSFSFAMESETSYNGDIGGLFNTPTAGDYLYDFGMFVRTMSYPGRSGYRYQIIDFWTENFTNPPACP